MYQLGFESASNNKNSKVSVAEVEIINLELERQLQKTIRDPGSFYTMASSSASCPKTVT